MPEFDSTVSYRDIEGFPGYKVGNDGSVWSCWEVFHPSGVKGSCLSRMTESWKRLRVYADQAGRPGLTLAGNGKRSFRRVCRIVLESFVGPCPPGMQACHFPDRDPTNNSLSNLRWDTVKSNSADSEAHGTRVRGEKAGAARLTEEKVRDIKRLLSAGVFHKSIARMFGVCTSTISWISRGQTWKHVG